MKIVFASTPCQEEEMKELVEQFYSDIFPHYFSDQEISNFQRQKVLYSSFEQFGTLKDAYQVITSLQTLILLLENVSPDMQYAEIFYRNAATLHEYGLHFPFEFTDFVEAKKTGSIEFSQYIRPANELLI